MRHWLRGDRGGTWSYIAVLFFIGLALRPQYSGIPPLLPRIQVEFDLSYGIASALTAVPVLFLGLMAFTGPYVTRRYGTSRTILVSLWVILVLSVLRAGVPTGWALIAITIPMGAAIGLAGALIPATAEPLSPRLRGIAMSVFAMGLQVGTGGGAAIAGLLASMTAGWRIPLLLLAFPLLAAAWGWAAQRRRLPAAALRIGTGGATTWTLVLVFGVQGAAFHGTATWLPAHFQESGWGEPESGLALGVLNAAALLGTAAVAAQVRSFASRRVALIVSSVVLGAGLLLIALLPQQGLVWVVVAGVAFGTLFPVAITLPLDLARDGSHALVLTATTLGFGYLIASATSFVTGIVRDLTGSFVLVFLLLALSGPVLAVTANRLTPRP